MSYRPQKHVSIDGKLVPICPYCQIPTVLRQYPKGATWCCTEAGCGARVGVHRDSTRFAPLGYPARTELRVARVRCHAMFDPLWQGPDAIFPRRLDAYAWLADALVMGVNRCHFAEFDLGTCARAEELIVNLKASKA